MGADIDRWREGVRLFNEGAYWECHEVLEPLWQAAEGLDRSFYKGVILLAAALHKARAMGNARGGRRNYAKALAHLALVPDSYHGVNVRELEAQCHAALRHASLQPSIPMESA
jgi:predicted metal-dependent hydrolase